MLSNRATVSNFRIHAILMFRITHTRLYKCGVVKQLEVYYLNRCYKDKLE
jgi:hypothetical protein